jgi:hypothetical protein
LRRLRGTGAGADEIEGGGAVLVECAEQVLFDDRRALHPQTVEDVEAIADLVDA